MRKPLFQTSNMTNNYEFGSPNSNALERDAPAFPLIGTNYGFGPPRAGRKSRPFRFCKMRFLHFAVIHAMRSEWRLSALRAMAPCISSPRHECRERAATGLLHLRNKLPTATRTLYDIDRTSGIEKPMRI